MAGELQQQLENRINGNLPKLHLGNAFIINHLEISLLFCHIGAEFSLCHWQKLCVCSVLGRWQSLQFQKSKAGSWLSSTNAYNLFWSRSWSNWEMSLMGATPGACQQTKSKMNGTNEYSTAKANQPIFITIISVGGSVPNPGLPGSCLAFTGSCFWYL